MFITPKNTIVVARYDNGQILIWRNSSFNPSTTILANLHSPVGLFVTTDEQIFVDNGGVTEGRVDRWTLDGTQLPSLTFLYSSCFGFFVDVNNTRYCSASDQHQVVSQSLQDPSPRLTVIAGTGVAGSTADMLQGPLGIFLATNLDLYVADHVNDRIQLFQPGEMNATTVVGNGRTGTIVLSRPTGILVDGEGYMFIVDHNNHRVVGSGPDGFRCVVGCSESEGPASYQLYYPWTMSFDSDGNIFVLDRMNNRIQKFLLSNNSCSK